uniref:Zgc:171971 n=1 Tax=Astyanax mexicanus TaxID=7994 RepID=A0A8B9H4Z2_ASTMX
MAEPSEGSQSGPLRPPFALGRGLPGRPLLSPPPPGRLTSLRSRDLTLGGYKKKTFVPNVHSVRKSKDELKEEDHTAPKKERREREDRQRERKRRERPQTIQSHSIFEQGPADTIRKIGIITKNNKTLIKNILKEKCSFLVSTEMTKCSKVHFVKVQLVLIINDSVSTVKEESPHHTCLKSPRTQRRELPCTNQFHAGDQPSTVGDLFQNLSVSDKEELLFIQLPDTIPGPQKASSSDKSSKKEGKEKPEDKQTSYSKAQDPGEKEAVPVLSDFSEGLIGRLQIRKSGKVQLAMGDITLDVSEGAAFSFLQQLVSVRLTEGLTGDMTVLGNVTHKLVCSPDFEALLQGVKTTPPTQSLSKF